MEVVIAKKVWKRYGMTVALKDVTLCLEEGLHVLVGPNGSGKSTFLKIILGFLQPTSGEVLVLGRNPWSHYPELSRSIAFSLEGMPLPWWKSGYDFLNDVCRMRGCEWDRLLRAASHLDVRNYWHRSIAGYSSGMKKKIILLLALGFDAKLYVFDEPFTLIDRDTLTKVIDSIIELTENGRTVIVATHYIPDRFIETINSTIEFFDGMAKQTSGPPAYYNTLT